MICMEFKLNSQKIVAGCQFTPYFIYLKCHIKGFMKNVYLLSMVEFSNFT